MIEQHEPRSRRDRGQHRLGQYVRAPRGKRHVGDHHPGARLLRHEAQRVGAGVVAVAGGEQLVTRREVERAEHRVDAGGGVGDEDEIVTLRADELREPRAGHLAQRLELAHHEAHGLGLELIAKLTLLFEHHARRRPEAAVIEEVNRVVELPRVAHARPADHSERASG